MVGVRSFAAALLVVVAMPTIVWSDQAALDTARSLLLRGRYAEAIDAAERLRGEQPIESVLLQAEALASTGKSEEGARLLGELVERESNSPTVLRGLIAWQARHRAQELKPEFVQRLLDLEPNDLVGRWHAAQLLLRDGTHPQAREALAWFAAERESLKPASAEESLALAAGLVEHGRWSRESKWFNIAVNEVLADAEKEHPLDWRIPAQRARLFAEKHNDPASLDSLNAALAKNASAAELHALKARFAVDRFDLDAARRLIALAKRINAEQRELPLLEADMAFAELRPDLAAEILSAESVASSGEVAGRLAAAREAQRVKGEKPADDETLNAANDVEALIAKGDALDRMRRFSQAAESYRQALERLPESPGIRGKLAHQLLRLAEEEEGASLLLEAAKEDPFDVRVKNTIAVLDVLRTYATLETEHFVLRFDRTHDELLARYAADYLEHEVYPDLVKRFGYEPQGKSVIEIYNRSRNTSGHGWFSARMVGVPGLHTIGACGGRIVALASPTDMPRPYNWARVLRHEFVHLLNLDQTAFNVPHWVTEGLAVTAEDRPRPDAWIRLLTRRYKDDALYTLDDINFGFIRPSSSDDWTAAYAQAQIYIEYLATKHGEESIAKLLAAYAENRSTAEAIERASGVSVEEFERGFREHLAGLVNSWGLLSSVASEDIARLNKRLAQSPEDPQILADLSAAHLAKGELPLARKHATQAARLSPRQATASYVLASLALMGNDSALAERVAQAALDPADPYEGLLLLLAEIKLANKQREVAEKLLLLGKRRFPALDQWNVRLARLYAQTGDDARLEPILTELIETQEDDASIRAKLMELAKERNDLAAARRWAIATLQVDVRHAAAHATLAVDHAARDEHALALAEWEAAAAADPEQPQWQLELALALLRTGQRERARKILEALADSSPALPGLVEAAEKLRD
jgi:cellulose synthase operon protein C